MTSVIDTPELILGDDLDIGVITGVSVTHSHDESPSVVVLSADNDDDQEELDVEEFDDDDFDDEFDDDFEAEDEGEYDVVEEFEDDFTFVDPSTKKPVTHREDTDDNKPDGDEEESVETEIPTDDGGADDQEAGKNEADVE